MDNPIVQVNGPLWTLQYEWSFYIVIMLLGIFNSLQGRVVLPLLFLANLIVTRYALFLSIARTDLTLLHQIYGVLIFLLALNFAGMLLAEFVMRFIRIPTLAVVGWIFAALQAALAIEVTLAGLKLAGFALH